ncbi:MAG: hypothetical protein ACI4PO_08050 [Faecousia sp.]
MMPLPRNVSKNLILFLAAQQAAEGAGKETFSCPVCGWDARWNRENNAKRLRCVCHGCGMYLQG